MSEKTSGTSKRWRGFIMFAFVLSIALAFAALRQGDKNAAGNDARSVRPTPKAGRQVPPNLFVLTHTRLVDLRWDLAKGDYAHHATTTLHMKLKRSGSIITGCRDYVSVGDKYVFVMNGNDVFRLDKKLRVAISVTFGKLAAIAARGRYVFVSADGHFIVLDEEFKELSRVPLDCGGGLFSSSRKPKLKNAHDILLYKDTAYLLDNIMRPIFIFQVDVSLPERLTVIRRIDGMGVNTHLRTQCLDPQFDHWLVIKDQSIRSGSFEYVQMLSMSSGRTLTECGTWSRGKGMKILGITRLARIWAVVDDSTNRRAHLVRVNSSQGKVSFVPVSGLEPSAYVIKKDSPYLFILLRRKGGHLFIGRQGGAALEVVDVTREPKMLLKTSLERFGIDKVLDIRPH